MTKTRLLLIFDLVLVLVIALYSPTLYSKIIQSQPPTNTTTNISAQNIKQILPIKVDIPMTFYPQAPYANWKQPWQDACEEASVLLIANKYNNYNWTRAQFRDQILQLVDWENKTFGEYKDNNSQQIIQILQDRYNLKSIVHTNPTFEDIQTILAQEHLIIIPLAGKEIGNPFFKNGGPIYHVIVIKGYNSTNQTVITEDVGTSHGENYIYSWETLQKANHDYSTPIENGKKIIIEVLP